MSADRILASRAKLVVAVIASAAAIACSDNNTADICIEPANFGESARPDTALTLHNPDSGDADADDASVADSSTEDAAIPRPDEP